MRESQYQAQLIKKLERMFPGSIVLKNDARRRQGLPDILILYNDTWAALEIKLADNSGVQPNQEYYVDMLHEMSFASFINPQNEEAVLGDLQRAFRAVHETRLSKS